MNLSGQISVTTAGTAVQGPDVVSGEFILKAHPSNTGAIWVGNVSGDVTNANGLPLQPGESLPVKVSNLNALWFDADADGEKCCWFRYS
jgi:hypothetical protein